MISSKEAAKRLGVSQRRVNKLIEDGQLAAEKISGVWLIEESSVDERLRVVQPKGGRPRRGNGRNEQKFMLMNRTHEIAPLVYNTEQKEFTSIGELVDISRAPIGLLQGSVLPIVEFRKWWRGRGIPASRVGLSHLLNQAGVSVPDELLHLNLGLSLSDQYWICPDHSGLTWDAINFFDNDFEESEFAIAPFASTPNTARVHPDNTSDGNLEKSWMIRNGMRVLRKRGMHNNQEPFNEVVATALHKRLLDNDEYIAYTLEWEKDSAWSCCQNFLTNKEEYVPAYYVYKLKDQRFSEDSYRHYLSCCEELGATGVRDALNRMIVCDDILANYDRHFRNFGLIRDIETLECRPAPIFDSGSCLWCNVGIKALQQGENSFLSSQFYESPAHQMLLVDDLSWFDINAMNGFVDEAMGILSEDEDIKERLPYLHDALEWRVERMINIAEWS